MFTSSFGFGIGMSQAAGAARFYNYWMSRTGSGYEETGRMIDAKVDVFGNIYTLYEKRILTKMDSVGNILWSFFYSLPADLGRGLGTEFDRSTNGSLALDPNQDIIYHHTTASPYFHGVTKISKTDGSVLWTRTTSEDASGWIGIIATGVTVDPAGNIYIACQDGQGSGPDHDLWDRSYLIVKFNNDGAFQWQRKIAMGTQVSTTNLNDSPYTIVASYTHVYFGGWLGEYGVATFFGALTVDGTLSWAKTISPGNGMQGSAVDSSGNVYFSEYKAPQAATGILKFNNTGTLIWAKRFLEFGMAKVHIDSSDNIYYVAELNPELDGGTYKTGLFIKLDTSGTLISRQRLSTSSLVFDFPIVAPFPVASSNSVFVGVKDYTSYPANANVYGVITSTGTNFNSGGWVVTTTATTFANYSPTMTNRTPTVSIYTPTIITTPVTKTVYTPGSRSLTPL